MNVYSAINYFSKIGTIHFTREDTQLLAQGHTTY